MCIVPFCSFISLDIEKWLKDTLSFEIDFYVCQCMREKSNANKIIKFSKL